MTVPLLGTIPRPPRVPLSSQQQRVWFLDRLDGPSDAYNLAAAVTLTGALDVTALQAAVRDLVWRHESLRTLFPNDAGVPWQQVLAAAAVDVPMPQVETCPDHLRQQLADEAHRPFILDGEIPFRARLFRLGPAEHVLLLTTHHIATDGWSISRVMLRDLFRCYAWHAGVEAAAPSPPALQYADYALWHGLALGSEDDSSSRLARELAFWTETLADLPEEMDLPADRPRAATALVPAGTVPVRIGDDVHGRLMQLARETRVTLFMVLHAAVAALLTRLGGGTDVAIGTAVAGRSVPALEDVVGFFANTLVLRTDTSGNPTFRELLARVRKQDLAAFKQSEMPFERLVDVLKPSRSLNRNPLFQVMLTLRTMGPVSHPVPGLTAREKSIEPGIAKFDLRFNLRQTAPDRECGGIDGELEYRSDLFDRPTAEGIAQRLTQVLERVASDPDRSVGALDLLTPAEYRQLAAWSGSPGRPDPLLVLDAIHAQRQQRPDAPALRCGDSILTYRELDARADAIAESLLQHRARADDIVAVGLTRSTALVPALLGVWKAGAACLPLDPDHPQERLASIVQDARPICVIGNRATIARLPAGTAAVCLDELPSPLAATTARAQPAPRPEHSAYVLYTSGSTGTPKGVVITHRSFAGFLDAARALVPLRPGDTHLAVAAPTFDISFCDMFLPLCCGAATELTRSEDVHDPMRLAALVRRPHITSMQATPAHLDLLVQVDPECLQGTTVIAAGEALSPALGAALRRAAAQVLNAYGPTEATIWTTVHDVRQEDVEAPVWQSISIGRPLAGYSVHVLGSFLDRVPPGVVGELYVGGSAVARAYLNRPALTASRFIADPYGAPGSRMYRTGDRVKWARDGTLTFLGRADHQVKIRGVRVELGEIEQVLRAQPEVAQAVAVFRAWSERPKQLVAYVTATPHARLDGHGLRAALERVLPDYMLPTVVVLDRLPLTPSGKIDRARLPAPERPEAAADERPSTATERVLCEVVGGVLGRDSVSIDEDFFQLGGDSILSIQVAMRAHTQGVALTTRDVFERRTIRRLAAAIDCRTAETPIGSDVRAASYERALPYWLEVAATPSISLGVASAAGLDGGARSAPVERLTIALPPHTSARLLTDVSAVFHARVDEIVLTALFVAVAYRGRQRGTWHNGAVRLDVGSDCRHDAAAAGEVSCTVACSTPRYPVRLDLRSCDIDAAWRGERALGQALQTVKEQWRAVPEGGIGYRVLRDSTLDAAEPLRGASVPELMFSYGGRFSVSEDADQASLGRVPPHEGRPAAVQAHAVALTAWIADLHDGAELRASWSWRPELIGDDEVRQLAAAWTHVLNALVSHAAQPGAGGLSPSDVPLISLTQAEIDMLQNAARATRPA